MNKLKTVSLCSSCMNVPTPRYTRSTSRADSLDQQMVLKGHESAGVAKREKPERHAEHRDLPDVRFLQESRQEKNLRGLRLGCQAFQPSNVQVEKWGSRSEKLQNEIRESSACGAGPLSRAFFQEKRLQLQFSTPLCLSNGTPGPTNQRAHKSRQTQMTMRKRKNRGTQLMRTTALGVYQTLLPGTNLCRAPCGCGGAYRPKLAEFGPPPSYFLKKSAPT